MRVKQLFFDRQAVMNAMDKATRRVLSRFGAFVRSTARRSIRKRKRPSLPGQPPSSHQGHLKRFLFFSYDPAARSVVIGPVKLGSKKGSTPEVLEYGGVSVNRRKGKTTRSVISARPYMGPAFKKEESKLAGLWRDSVR